MSHALDQYRKDFIKTMETISHRHFIVDVFGDFVAAMACSLEQLCNDAKDREDRYKSVTSKYEKDELAKFPELMENVVNALSVSRESYLGPILEEIGAANTHNGQFLTPNDVAKVMAEINADKYVHKPGELITMNDPAVGAGVTMIQGGEALLRKGVPQRDIFIECGDIDHRACDMTFIELTLLGYSACVKHQNALTMEMISRPRWTFGFYLHGTQWKLKRRNEQCFDSSESGITAETSGARGEVESTSRRDESLTSSAQNAVPSASASMMGRLEQAVFQI